MVLQLVERMQRDFAQPLTEARIAEELKMNASYLSSVFARVVGVPFKSYLTMLRLERAQILLGDPRRCISDVALEVGYSSRDRFRAAFRAWTGLSPRRWRRSFRIQSEE
jgi:two-component system response regulator YesN